MDVILTKTDIDQLEEIISDEILDAGADYVMIVDLSGNLILHKGSLEMNDTFSLAALSAANFAATAQIAKLIGEEDFSLLFHKGDKKNIHFSRLGTNYIILTLFDENVSLGLIRLKLNSAIEQLARVFDDSEGMH
jgi:predicted regulator of Ras-like GTPase activity (Roadblock/LC7/MglB family)